MFFFLYTERQSRGVFNYAYGQAGMSLQMIRDPKVGLLFQGFQILSRILAIVGILGRILWKIPADSRIFEGLFHHISMTGNGADDYRSPGHVQLDGNDRPGQRILHHLHERSRRRSVTVGFHVQRLRSATDPQRHPVAAVSGQRVSR